MKRTINIIIIVCMALQFLTGCTSRVKVSWRPGINAPKYYPARLVSGKFSDGKNICMIATGVPRCGGWGYGGLEMTTADFIPNQLSVLWFSFAEDKFYEGTFSLPSDTMRQLFKQGCYNGRGVHTEYHNLIVNLYPGGGVAVWINGACRQVEIGHYQGKETEYNWRSMFNSVFEDTREEYNEFILSTTEGATEYIAQHGISQEPYKTVCRQRYNYTFAIEGITNQDTKSVYVKFYNGEEDIAWGKELENNFFKTKAVPKYISVKWRENGVVYFSEFDSKEAEMFKAFADISAARPDEPFVLLLKPDYSRRSLTVLLRSQPDANGEVYEIELLKKGVTGKSLNQKFANETK